MERLFKDNQYKPFLALLCAFGWSLAYPLIKIGYQQFRIDPGDLGGKILFAGVRFFCAGLFVLLFCRSRHMNTGLRSKKDFLWLLLLAVVNTTLHYMFAYIGLSYNSSARSTILDSMGGFFLIILSALFFPDDKLSSSKMIGCILGILGIVAINLRPGVNFFEDITFRGDGMILLNACCAAFGGLITRIVSRKMHIMPATGLGMLIGGALLLLTGVLAGTTSSWNFSPAGCLVLLALVAISAVCFAVYNALLANHPISKIAIYNALIPVLGVIFAALLLGEALKWQYFGAVAVVAWGILLVNRDPRHK